jgi:hypothetical protein
MSSGLLKKRFGCTTGKKVFFFLVFYVLIDGNGAICGALGDR